ncbi:hypothetical protein DRE_06096 [Drechslerella stenobrocha 248]|uniref:Fork-head domain-containing protein n=1 Tax=Drechslerella stenobrocha 248 TaxID=1043628 RepID=W7HZ35_9PEZI|nr:hypothetical protein DRE_06096 [Drechslerella stenobrocha 248]
MADVETNDSREGRVAGQIITPRPSPDEAVQFAGEETQRQTTGPAQPIALEPVSGVHQQHEVEVVVQDDNGGIAVTADTNEHDTFANRTDVNEPIAPPSTSSATSPSTVNNEENTIEENPGSTIESVGDREAALPPETVVMSDTATPAMAASHQGTNDTEMLDAFHQPIELSNLDLQAVESGLMTTLSAEDMLNKVDGGAWFPSHPENGITPRIEAFAKLEFHHGQDFYLSSVNIVLGRQDKDAAKANRHRKSLRSANAHADGASADEIKVPLFPPPERDISSISRRHLRIQYNYQSSAWELTSLCDTGFKLSRGGKSRNHRNGKSCLLQNTDIVTFGALGFTFYLPQDEPDDRQSSEDCQAEEIDEEEEEEIAGRIQKSRAISSNLDSDNDSDDGDDEDEDSDLDSRENSNEVGSPATGTSKLGTDDASLMPPPPIKRGRGRPPKNGISVREQKLLKRQAQEEFLANGGNVANLDMTKYGNLPVEKLFAKEGERMQLQLEKEARRKQKLEEKEAKLREKQAAKDSKPVKVTKERKRKRSKSPPPREEDYAPEQLAKPTMPYTVMIYDAIKNSEKQALTLPEIYRSLETTYPYFKVKAETTGWQSSVRHNLRGSGEGGSVLFERGEKSGKGYIWKIAEGANIDKERKKRKPMGSPSVATTAHSQVTVPSGGNWGQAGTTAQISHPNSFGQQYQTHPTQPIPNYAPRSGPTYSQASHQATTPAVPSAPIPNLVSHPQARASNPAPPSVQRPLTENQPVTGPRAVSQAAVPPPPTWNPSQAKVNIAPVPAATNGNPSVSPVQHVRQNGVVNQVQSTARQSLVAAQLQKPPAQATSTHGHIPPPPLSIRKLPTNGGESRVSIASDVSITRPVSSEVDSKARDLLDNPTFLKLMREHMVKHPGHDINSPEVRKSLWAEFKQKTGRKLPILSQNIPRVPAVKSPASSLAGDVPQKQVPVAVASQVVNTPINRPPTNNGTVTMASKTVAQPPTAPQTPTAQATQVKPSVSASLPQRAGALFKNLPMDPKRRAELLQALKNAKERKAAEAKASPTIGIKRAAETVADNAPLPKRTAIEGQQ